MDDMQFLKSNKEAIEIEPGIYYDVPEEEYFRWNCFSKSMVNAALSGPDKLHEHLNKTRRKSDAMILGSMVDCLVMEPQLFVERFAVQPLTYTDTKGATKPFTSRSNVCKAMIAEAEERGQEMVSNALHAKAMKMRNALAGNLEALQSITGSKKQVSIAWVNGATGLLCKGRLDLSNDSTLDDLKTSRDSGEESFSRDIASLCYDVQGGVYQREYGKLVGCGDLPFRFIVVENCDFECIDPPVKIYNLEYEAAEIGRWKFDRACAAATVYKNIKSLSEVPNFAEPITVPRWHFNNEVNHQFHSGRTFEE